MSFLDDLVQGDEPVEREVTLGGKAGKVHFRKITAAQKDALLDGEKAQGRMGEKITVEVDFKKANQKKQQLVQFSVCNADGTPFFKSLDAVSKLQQDRVDVLYEHAKAVNDPAEEADAKKG